MSVRFLSGIDLEQTSLIRAVIHPVTTDPSSPVDGQIWYRSDTDTFHIQANGVVETLAYSSGSGIPGSTWDAQSVVVAVTDNNPVAQTIGEDEVLGRSAGGDIGALTKTDLLTLLNVQDGATDDQSAAEILAALLTVDGAGSGLDADTLDGTQLADLATVAYVDAATQGLSPKDSVRAATTADITLSGAQTIDGVSVVAGDRVLVKDQAAPAENGIYVADAAAWSRAGDSDSEDDLLGAMTFVQEGTTQGDTAWLLTTDAPITVDTTALSFTQFGAGQVYTEGAGIDIVGNVISVETGGVTDAMLASTFTKKFADDIGDGATTAIGVTHNLGTEDVTIEVFDSATKETVECDKVRTSANVVTLTFEAAPAVDEFRVVIVG